jgi:hypothetical protein
MTERLCPRCGRPATTPNPLCSYNWTPTRADLFRPPPKPASNRNKEA